MTATPTTAPVVLATDGTTASDGALRYAVQQAQMHETGLRVLHVMPVPIPVPPLRPMESVDLEPYARAVISRAADQVRGLAPELIVSTSLAHGGRVRAIVAGSADAQLVVVGRETVHGLERLLTGATTAGVAANARCAVVVVPGDWQPRERAERGGSVVVGIRRKDDASHVMAEAHRQAVALDASITVVHAWQLPDPYFDRIEARTHGEEWQALGEKLLEEALGPWHDQYPYLAIETRVVHGHPATVLAAAAKGADLVVVRRAHEGRPFDHLGATVRALLLASPAPVEVVPAHVGGSAT
ncbi:universal stress protein [Nocardioides agariphilus]|uniref:Universal stress protein n=1 Tax=Nocardioides agariphilus TaxID=433664 RepID=A0A930YG37_9ACTN|nr:universal stress protein [Nocardioides agariphilus]MBF4767171.1 universal stress protein [Nocardioides agariphilus]